LQGLLTDETAREELRSRQSEYVERLHALPDARAAVRMMTESLE
jgi:hypothetical protein